MAKKKSKKYLKLHEIHPAHKFHYAMIGVILVLILAIIILASYTTYKMTEEKNKCAELTNIEERDNCYLQYAIDANDKKVCNAIIVNYLRESCYAL